MYQNGFAQLLADLSVCTHKWGRIRLDLIVLMVASLPTFISSRQHQRDFVR